MTSAQPLSSTVTSNKDHAIWNAVIRDVSKKFYDRFQPNCRFNLYHISSQQTPIYEILSIQYPEVYEEVPYAMRLILTYNINRKFITIDRFSVKLNNLKQLSQFYDKSDSNFSVEAVDIKTFSTFGIKNLGEVYEAINKVFSEKMTFDP